MKIVVHTSGDFLTKFTRLCCSLELIDHFEELVGYDLIYIFSEMYVNGPKVKCHTIILKDEIQIVLRRQGYVQMCILDSCKCKGLKTDFDEIKNFIFTGKVNIDMTRKKQIIYDPDIKLSGFGLYVMDIIGEVINIYKNETVHIHGCEFETVKYVYDKKMLNVVMFGLPEYEEDEFILESEWGINVLGVDQLNNWMGYSIENFIIRDCFSYIECKGSDENLDEFANAFIYVLKKISTIGVSVFGPLFGDVFKLVGDSIEMSKFDLECKTLQDSVKNKVYPQCVIYATEIIDDKSIRLMLDSFKGFVNRIFFSRNGIVKDLRLQCLIMSEYYSVYLLKTGYKQLSTVEELNNRQFRSFFERLRIKRLDMFNDDSTNLKIAMFSISNQINFNKIKKAKSKKIAPLKGRQIIMLPGAEAYGRIFGVNVDGRRPRIKEYKDVVDICFYNLEVARMGLDCMTIKDFEVMIYPSGYSPKSNIIFNISDKKTFYYNICCNILTSGVQNVVNSPSMNKSISTKIKTDFHMDEEELHRIRFEILKSIRGMNDLIYHKEGMWSLCYYIDPKDGKYRFIDTSGHTINLCLALAIETKNLIAYMRMKKLNLDSSVKDEVSPIEQRFISYRSGEDRGILGGIWHLAEEDYTAIKIASILIKRFSLPSVDFTQMTLLFDELKYPKYRKSIPVEHDLRIFS